MATYPSVVDSHGRVKKAQQQTIVGDICVENGVSGSDCRSKEADLSADEQVEQNSGQGDNPVVSGSEGSTALPQTVRVPMPRRSLFVMWGSPRWVSLCS